MKITKLQLPESGLFDSLFHHFDGRVFHRTDESIHNILGCREIRPNKHGLYSSPVGFSGNGFFRNRGCVSLFDYRPETKKELTTQEKLDFYMWKCPPTMNAPPGSVLAFLFISESVYPDLLPWTLNKEERAWGERVVPYFETGHRGPITLDKIEEIILVLVIEDPVKREREKTFFDYLQEANRRSPPPKDRITEEMLNDPDWGHFWRNVLTVRERLERRWKVIEAARAGGKTPPTPITQEMLDDPEHGESWRQLHEGRERAKRLRSVIEQRLIEYKSADSDKIDSIDVTPVPEGDDGETY